MRHLRRVFCLIDSTLSLSDAGSILGSEASGSEWGDNSAHQTQSDYSLQSATTDHRARPTSNAQPRSVWDERSQASSASPNNHHYTSYPGPANSRPTPPRPPYTNSSHAGSYPGASGSQFGSAAQLLPPPPRPPLPPPPPSSYRPSLSSPPDPYDFDDSRTESSYAAPPGRSPEFSRPTPPRETSNGTGVHPFGVIKPKAGVGSLFPTPSGASSGSSSSSSRSSVGRAGRRFRNKGSVYGGSSVRTTPEEDEHEDEDEGRSVRGGIPLSAPPTYKSGSGKSEVGEDLQQRWLRAQRVNVKGKARAYSISDSESAYSGAGRAAGPSHDRHYLHDHHGASTSQQPHPGPAEFDLPTLLHDLSLSRMPAPSVLSSVPDAMLSCSACKRRMEDFRYICCQCGPRQLEQALSDDGTQVNFRNEEGDDGASVDGTVNSFGTESAAETKALLDGHGEVDPSRIALPLSPATSPTTTSNGRVTDPLGASVFSSGQARPSLAGVLASAGADTDATQPDDDPAWSGYELCSECVEKEGPRHAAAMAKVAADQAFMEGELSEVRHSFAEVMKTHDFGGEWREVDYDNDVECSICGDGPLQTSRFKCLSCSKFEMCLQCWRSVDEIHPAHAFLSVPDRPARPPADLLEDVRPTVNGQPTVEDLRLAFLRARGLVGSNGERVQDPGYSNSATSMPSRSSALQSVEHPQFCFGCLQNIRGPRFSCSVCLAFDLCGSCESKTDPPITSPDGRHEPSHIMLKITVPVPEEVVEDASERARLVSRGSSSSLYRRDESPPRQRGGGRGRAIEYDRQSRDWDQPRWQHDPRNGGYAQPPPPSWALLPPPPPPHYGGREHFPPPPWEHGRPTYFSQDALRHVVHQVACRRCRRAIQGVRWLCAQCPTTPATYDLVSDCDNERETTADCKLLRVADCLHNGCL